jgi:hypothetical protein
MFFDFFFVIFVASWLKIRFARPSPRRKVIHCSTLRIHSLKSDRLEGALKVLDRRLPLAGGPGDRDDVEAGSAFKQIVPLQIRQGQPSEPPLLGLIDGISWMAGIVAGARLHFDEHNRPAIDDNQIQFANLIAVPASDDDVAELPQVARSRVLATAAERLGLE